MAATTPQARIFLEWIYDQSTSDNAPLLAALKAFAFALAGKASAGGDIESTSSGSKTVSFGRSIGLATGDLLETSDKFLRLYRVVAQSETTDEAIFNGMMLRLRAVKTVTTRFCVEP